MAVLWKLHAAMKITQELLSYVQQNRENYEDQLPLLQGEKVEGPFLG